MSRRIRRVDTRRQSRPLGKGCFPDDVSFVMRRPRRDAYAHHKVHREILCPCSATGHGGRRSVNWFGELIRPGILDIGCHRLCRRGRRPCGGFDAGGIANSNVDRIGIETRIGRDCGCGGRGSTFRAGSRVSSSSMTRDGLPVTVGTEETIKRVASAARATRHLNQFLCERGDSPRCVVTYPIVGSLSRFSETSRK